MAGMLRSFECIHTEKMGKGDSRHWFSLIGIYSIYNTAGYANLIRKSSCTSSRLSITPIAKAGTSLVVKCTRIKL